MPLRADPVRHDGVIRRAGVLAIAACLPIGVLPVARAATPFESRQATVLPQGEIDQWIVTVDHFSSRVALQSALRQARTQWQTSGPVIEARSGEWHTLSRIDGDHIRTLQIRVAPGGGSEGYDSTWRRREVGPSMLRDILPAVATLLGATASQDGTRRGETLVAEVPSEPAALGLLTTQALLRLGFAPVALTEARAREEGARFDAGWRARDGASELLMFRRSDAEIVVMMTPGRRPGWTSWVAHRTGDSR